jgi:hypothetical protein
MSIIFSNRAAVAVANNDGQTFGAPPRVRAIAVQLSGLLFCNRVKLLNLHFSSTHENKNTHQSFPYSLHLLHTSCPAYHFH